MPITLTKKALGLQEMEKTRIANSTRATALAQCTSAKGRIALGKVKDWAGLSAQLNYEISPGLTSLPWERENWEMCLDWFVSSAVARSTALFDSKAIEAAAVLETVVKNNVAFAKVQLRPQQKKALDQIIAAYEAGKRAVLVAMGTGRGKTVVFGAFIEWLKRRGTVDGDNFLLPKACIFTKKPAVWSTRHKIENFFDLYCTGDAQDKMDAEVGVYHYNALSAKKHASKWKRDPKTGELLLNSVEMFGNAFTFPVSALVEPLNLVVFDECHMLKKRSAKCTKRARGIMASVAAKKCFYIFTSATPAVCLNDTMLFNIAAELATDENMATFLGRFGGDPSQADPIAMRKYNDYLGIHMVKPPEDKLPYKVTNRVDLVDFPCAATKEKYMAAEADYIRAVESSGGVAGDTSMSQFIIYRRCAEVLMAPVYADYMCRARARGIAPVLAVCFIDTVTSVSAILAKRGWKREELSYIWGGEKIIEQSECYTTAEMARILSRADEEILKYTEAFGEPPEDDYFFLTRKEKAKFTRTRAYNKARLRRGETKLEQIERTEMLKDYKLDKQTDLEREVELDKFLKDVTLGCIFTFASGGTGIDLDNQIKGGRPRELISTVCYWAEEFLQAFGRCARVMTQSDVSHIILMFKDTLPVQHVLPRLLPKLRSIKILTGIEGDLEDVMATGIRKGHKAEIIKESKEVVQDGIITDEDDGDDDDDGEDEK